MTEEMSEAWEIPLSDVVVRKISWYPEALGGELAKAVCFPYAQHMLSDSPGKSTFYGSKSALRRAAKSTKFGS